MGKVVTRFLSHISASQSRSQRDVETTKNRAESWNSGDFPGSYTGGGVDAHQGTPHLQLCAISRGLAEASLSTQPGSRRKQWVRVSHSKVTRSESPDAYTMPGPWIDRQH